MSTRRGTRVAARRAMSTTSKGLLGAAIGLGTYAAWRLLGRDAWTYEGRVVVITGGSRGLGLVLARELAQEGAKLVLLARDVGELASAERELRASGADVLVLECDVRKPWTIEAAIQHAVERYGRLDVLVNNAGIIQSGPIEHQEVAEFEEAMAVHFWGPLHAIRAAVPHLERAPGGARIVNVSSIGGVVAVPHLAPYSASKFALKGLSDALRAELRKNGILVTTVCPGLMRTGSHLNAFFKGNHRLEFALFAIMDALPFSSIDAGRAARQILAASRRGDAHLTITWQARLAEIASHVFPNLWGEAFALVGRLLPGPTSEEGNELRTGWESRSAWAPSFLTRLADRATERNNELRGHAPPARAIARGRGEKAA